MESAILACKNGTSLRKAAKTFGVNYTTLYYHMRGMRQGKHGKQRFFNPQEEKFITDLLLRAADAGIPFTKQLLRRIVAQFCKTTGKEEPKLSAKWLKAYLQRNPQISERISSASKRKKLKEYISDAREGWIKLLSQLHIDGFLSEPEGIFNLGEFVLMECVSGVLERKGRKSVVSYSDESQRNPVTVLACAAATGKMLKPAILSDGEIDTDTSYVVDYVKNELIPLMTAPKNVIFVDSDNLHLSQNLEFLYACLDSGKNIKVVGYPAGQADKFQPLNAAVFDPVKKHWTEFLHSQASTKGQPVTTQNVAAVFTEKWSQLNLESSMKSAFEKSGIFPFDPRQIVTPVETHVEALVNEAVVEAEIKLAQVYRNELSEVRAALKKIHPLSEKGIEDVINYAIRRAEGFCSGNCNGKHG